MRARLYTVLRQSDSNSGARRWRAFHLSALLAGLLAVALSTVDNMPFVVQRTLIAVIFLVTAIFFFEYLTRLWVAPESPRYAGRSAAFARWRWAISSTGLIGLLAILPAVALATRYSVAGTDAASIFCFFWILKLGLHAPSTETLGRVISNERERLPVS